MAPNTSLKAETYRFSPPKPISQYPKESIKKMAVLFTDIVGSSNYFKAHGDITGRKMLKLHQDMVSPLISEFGGSLVKLLGDSVMAYFLNPLEAIKSAIKIQQRFQGYNGRKDVRDQIHIRIMIHFGNGIVEERDIFGDVVNTAAKLLPFVDGDQIFVSQEIKENAGRLSSISFDPVDISGKNGSTGKLRVFRILWDQGINLDPVMNNLLYLRPVWSLGEKGLTETWRAMVKKRQNLWQGNQVLKENVLADNSLAFITRDVYAALAIAKNVIKHLQLNLGQHGLTLLPLQIIIDAGHYLRAGIISVHDLKIDWNEIHPGEIYISASAYGNVKSGANFSIIRGTQKEQSNTFFKVVFHDNEKSGSRLFLYQHSMIQGENSPCFYCGDRRHHTAECPSKHLTEMTNFLEKMGYLPMEEINNLFFQYLNDPQLEKAGGFGSEDWGKENGRSFWARHVFYELNSIFQLRFFRTIWSLPEENWSKIKERRDDRNKGGLLWIGLDCIRVSNFQQAESILADTLSKKPDDYKVFCIAGFLSIEKNNYSQAQVYFKKALDFTKTTPQKMLILFLLSRIHNLNTDHLRERKILRRILNLSPYCPEALYLDVKYRLRNENREPALNQLTRLIKTNRDYYLISLIDPEISHFSDEIHQRIKRIYDEAKDEALRIYPAARDELERLEKLIGVDSKEVSEARSLLKKLEDLLNTDSYFGYVDIIHYGGSMINMSQRIIEGRTATLARKLWGVRQRLQKCLNRVNALDYSFFSRSISGEIGRLQKRADREEDRIESHKPGDFDKLRKRIEVLSIDLGSVENRLMRLDSIVQLLRFGTGFLKKSVLFQSANLIIDLILFPIMIHYLSFMLPEFNITPQSTWYYQKVLLILGAIAGIIIASLTTKNGLSRP